MMSTTATKAGPRDATAEADVAEAGDEHLDAGAGLPITAAPAEGEGTDDASASEGTRSARQWRSRLACILACGILPATALLLASAAGYLKWVDGSAEEADVARTQSVQAAVESTVAMLSYRPDTAESNLAAARDRMTGAFRDSYSSLTHDLVIPGAKQRQISAMATVPAASSVSATATRATVLVFVDQSTIIGNDPPTQSASSVKVTLEKVNGRWLISAFDPI
jgi:Mce-associated membrane protein